MFKKSISIIITIVLVISAVAVTNSASAKKKDKKPWKINEIYVSQSGGDSTDDPPRAVVYVFNDMHPDAQKYEFRMKGPDKFWHKYKVVKKSKKNKKKFTVKGKYKVKKKGKKKYQVYKYGVAYKSYYRKERAFYPKLKEGKTYYFKARGINGKVKGDWSKTIKHKWVPVYYYEEDPQGDDGDEY